MSDILRSVGLDVGTTSTQMIFSELTVENKASGFAVPEMEIARRDIRYRSPVYFTPLLDESHVDAGALRELVAEEYRKAGIRRESVDTGAIIITGETSRKENARAVLDALSDFAGEFVVATAGPDLESVLAAKGAGAVDYSQRTGKTVLHMDIGGGTSNLALIRDGKIERTGCLNVGGRLLKFDDGGTVTYVSPVLSGLCDLKPGDKASPGQVKTLAEILTQALEMAAGLREETPLLEQLTTREAGRFDPCQEKELVISFSGGVADCIEKELPWLEFGDLGPILGQTIRESRLCQGEFTLGSETIRATVIGAGCHATELSGSTVYFDRIAFPLKNLPVAALTPEEEHLPPAELAETVRARLAVFEGGPAVLALQGRRDLHFAALSALADGLAGGLRGRDGPVLVAVAADVGKALGQALAVRMPGVPLLCLDGVQLPPGSYLDVAAPIANGQVLPVVIKTLVF